MRRITCDMVANRLILIFAAVWFAGCATTKDPYFMQVESAANVFVAPIAAPVTKIAVMPFKGPTELIGSSVSDMIVTELLRAKRYTLVERSQMANVLSETELALAGLSQSKAMEVAKMLGADGVVIGTVDEYGTQAQRGQTYAVVGVSVRLVNASNGQILWSADLAKAASNANVPVSAHARAVVHELIAGLYQNWSVQRVVASAAAAHEINPNARVAMSGANPETALSEAPLCPDPPTGVTAGDMGLRSVTLSWKPPAEAACQIRIERSPSPKGPFTKVGEAPAARGTYTDRSGLADATPYYYRLVAVDRSGVTSAPSAVVESMTAPPPEPPDKIEAQATASREVTISWAPPRSPGVMSYRIERAAASAPSNWTFRGETTGTQLIDGGKPGTDLLDSTWYLYRITAVNEIGVTSAPSSPVKVKTRPPPAAVKEFAAVTNQVRCVPLSWAASPEPDVIGYEIERRDSPDGAFAALAKIPTRTTTNYLDGRRDPGILQDACRYEYRIRAFNRVGSFGEWTPPLAATTRPPPPAPESLAARGGLPRMMEIFWSPSPDEKVVGYEVQRTEGDADSSYVLAGRIEGRNEAFFTDRAGGKASEPAGRLKDGMKYRYRVRAINTAGAMSDWSEEAVGETKPAPTAPRGLKTTDDRPKVVELIWQENPEEDIASYVVESRAADSGRWREIGRAREPTFRHTGLGDGENLFYRIKAADKDTLESPWSEEVPGRSRPLPPVLQGLTATWTDHGARLEWTASEIAISEYRVYKKGFLFGSDRIATVKEPAADIEQTIIGKGLTLFVTAVDTEGLESKPSMTIEVRPPAATKP